MNIYLNSITTAIIVFPFIAFLITLPYLIINYNKYGSISKLRSLIIYSFVLYLLCSFFLVILPLPSREYVSNLTIPKYQLEPFYFIYDITSNEYNLNTFNTLLKIIKEPSFYQPLFNIILTIPFGIYLRYYYKCSFKKTLFLTICLTLFFEITQLTGIYGIYSRNYRMFDVDDIIFNTLGGILGYFICKPFLKILPSRESIDNKSFKMGKKVTGLRRFIAFIIDIFFISIVFGISLIIYLINNYSLNLINFIILLLIVNYVMLVLFPIIFKGKTIGKSLVRISVKSSDTKLYQVIIRTHLMYIYIVFIPLFSIILIYDNNLLGIISILIYIIYMFISIFVLFTNKLFWYEILTRTKNVSTIRVDELI